MTRPLTGDPIADALDALLSADAIAELASYTRGCRAVDEIAARIEHEAVRSDRASEAYAERGRYDLAAGEREAARRCRDQAAAIRTLDEHREQLRRAAERPPPAK